MPPPPNPPAPLTQEPSGGDPQKRAPVTPPWRPSGAPRAPGIITGETAHDKIIGHAIANGLMEIALEWGHPVSMGVLTCQTLEQAQARAGGNCGNKGIEAMNAAIETAITLREQNA